MNIDIIQRKIIDRLNVFLIILIVMTHSIITIDDRESFEYFNTFIFKTFTRIAVPIFFIISGFLLFRNYSYRKIKSRTRSVLVPYLLWSILSFGIFVFLAKLPYLGLFFNNKSISLSLESFIKCSFISPLNGALWFLRDLYILVLLSPIINILLKYKYIMKIIIFFIFIVWITDLKYSFLIESSLFFCIGAEFSKYKFSDYIKPRTNLVCIVLYLLICLIYPSFSNDYTVGSKFIILFGLITLYVNMGYFFRDSFVMKLFENLKHYSFFIYAFHLLIVQFIKKIWDILFGKSEINLVFFIILYIITVCITIGICYSVQKMFQKRVPKVIAILTGNRC